MNRRRFLAVTAAGVAGPLVASGTPRGNRLVSSDCGPLRRVLVHEPGPETRKVLSVVGGEHPLYAIDLLGPEAAAQHQGLVAALRDAGAEVVFVRDLLADAIEHARAAGEFDGWVETTLPALAEHADALNADALIGADDAFVYPSEHPGPLVQPLKFLCFVRDLGVMTPRGWIVGNVGTTARAFESTLFQFLVRWSPALSGPGVAFDATRAGIYLQGGDVIVADAATLFVGVGNMTEERVARKLAQRVGMDVLTVQLPGGRTRPGRLPGPAHGLRLKFLHLDTVFNLVAPRVALIVPYFFEAEHEGHDPLTVLVRGLAEGYHLDARHAEELASTLRAIGRVQLYKARSGESDPSVRGLKLADYLRGRGYQLIPIGGDPEGVDPVKHVVEHVLHELRFQAGNVVARAPGHVVAVGGNRRTIGALRATGADVEAVPLGDLARWYGGPHCLTLPLERGEA
jgi:arginine deiminase